MVVLACFSHDPSSDVLDSLQMAKGASRQSVKQRVAVVSSGGHKRMYKCFTGFPGQHTEDPTGILASCAKEALQAAVI